MLIIKKKNQEQIEDTSWSFTREFGYIKKHLKYTDF